MTDAPTLTPDLLAKAVAVLEPQEINDPTGRWPEDDWRSLTENVDLQLWATYADDDHPLTSDYAPHATLYAVVDGSTKLDAGTDITVELLQAIGYFQRQALKAVTKERQRQDKKWGLQDHTPLEWNAILGEEHGEVIKEVNEIHFRGKGADDYLKEMVEVAAVAVNAIENELRRRAATALAA